MPKLSSSVVFVLGMALACLAPNASANQDLVDRVSPDAAFGPVGHHWHSVEISPRIMIAMDAHRIEALEGSIRQVTTVSFSPKPMVLGGAAHDYLVLVFELDCAIEGRHRGVAAAGYIHRDGHWKQSGLETEPTEWNEASYGPLLSAWQMTCGSVPSQTALPEGLGFDEMLWIYRKVLEESKQP